VGGDIRDLKEQGFKIRQKTTQLGVSISLHLARLTHTGNPDAAQVSKELKYKGIIYTASDF
jgi:hypothetical protein